MWPIFEEGQQRYSEPKLENPWDLTRLRLCSKCPPWLAYSCYKQS